MAKWSEAQTTKFVKVYEENPCLWNSDMVEYRNREMRQFALENIVTTMAIPDFSIEDCKNKIKNVRSHYCQELKKIKSSIRSVSGTDNVYKPSLPWFDTLDGFLRGVVQQKTEPIITQTYTENVEDTKISTDNFDSGNIFTTPMPHSSSDQSKAPKRKREDGNVILSSALHRLEKKSANATTSTDNITEFDIFGQSIAVQLNNMPIVDALEIQLQIQQLLTKYRLKKLKSNSVTVQVAPTREASTPYSLEGKRVVDDRRRSTLKDYLYESTDDTLSS